VDRRYAMDPHGASTNDGLRGPMRVSGQFEREDKSECPVGDSNPYCGRAAPAFD
jgi:hypothetical protein